MGALQEVFQYRGILAGWPVTIQGTLDGIRRIRFETIRESTASGKILPIWLPGAIRQLKEYFQGERQAFDLPMAPPQGTAFQRKVWEACREIPYGKMTSYGALARRVGSPGAMRAIGQALNRNPLPLLVPCHRVVGKNGDLTGFAGGIEWKARLLSIEKAEPELWQWPAESKTFHARRKETRSR
jgi:methylated-DNA-[protein]-cysteine S-methyltransferase